METIWFLIAAVMLTIYVVLDGFDLGVGIVHLFAARTDAERRATIASIGPVWDGNEVWLLAAGGTLYFAFPGLYAAGFSGFYLALMVVLWLLMLRGISVEFRGHINNYVWKSLWDVVLCGASALLAIFYGAALGNVVRGVPLDKDGFFFTPFWTNFRPGADPGIIDWYTVLIGITALIVLTLHGALWVNLKTTGDVQKRARALAKPLVWAAGAAALVISIASFNVQPHLWESFSLRPWLWGFPVVGLAGLLAIAFSLSVDLEGWAFAGSAIFIVGLLCSAAFGLYPILLPAVPDSTRSLTVFNTAAPRYGLAIGFWWWTPAFLLAISYSAFIYHRFRGKVGVGEIEPKPSEVLIGR